MTQGLSDSRHTVAKTRRPRVGVIVITVLAAAFLVWLARPITHDPKTKGYLAQMKFDLMSLRTVEEWRHDSTGKFTRNISPPFESTPGVSPPTMTVSDSAWTATVTSTSYPGAVCGIAVGVANPIDSTAQPGEPVCVIRK